MSLPKSSITTGRNYLVGGLKTIEFHGPLDSVNHGAARCGNPPEQLQYE
jgi:hypothetical protein